MLTESVSEVGTDRLIDDSGMFIGADIASSPVPWQGAMEEVKVWGVRLVR